MDQSFTVAGELMNVCFVIVTIQHQFWWAHRQVGTSQKMAMTSAIER